MSKRLKGFRGAWSLKKMHSSKGTSFFKSLSKGRQGHWAAFDRKQSRRGLRKSAGL